MFLKNHWRMNWIQSKSKIPQQYCIYRRTKRQRFLDCISRRAHNVLFRSIKKPTMILTRGHHYPFPSFWCWLGCQVNNSTSTPYFKMFQCFLLVSKRLLCYKEKTNTVGVLTVLNTVVLYLCWKIIFMEKKS